MTEETIILGGGCFWCIEAVFQNLRGVSSVVSGYAGGDLENPTYQNISYDNTGHIEVIELKFDNKIISLRQIVEVFLTVHDPTTPMRQGPDEGYQYQSVVFYFDETQRKTIVEVIEDFENKKIYEDRIITNLFPYKNFYKAEDYHQNYFNNNPDQLYCKININPKISKLREKFSSLMK